MSSERQVQKAAFLASAGLADVQRKALSGDASTRSYERLYPADGPSLILMDQPPSAEAPPCPPDASEEDRQALGYNALARLAAGKVEAFVAVAAHLCTLGLSAPAVIAADPAAGYAVLEDLGDGLYARVIEQGQDETPLYDAAIDVLAALHGQTPPASLPYDGGRWPLLTYDRLALRTAVNLFVEWAPRLNPSLAFTYDAIEAWDDIWGPVCARAEAAAAVLCLRDYHAENLIWLPNRAGVGRVGLLDFQDAVIAHPAWDLSMLLHDARREISQALETACLERYLRAASVADRVAFMADFHALGALNTLRILGVFSRLIVRDAKPRYQEFMPRMWGYLDRCLTGPGLTDLKVWLDAHVPPEARR